MPFWRFMVVLALAAWQGAPAPEGVTVAVEYAGPGAVAPSTRLDDLTVLRADLGRIRRAGFDTITTWVNWAEVEPESGALNLAATVRLLAAAVEARLRVAIRLHTDPAPAWAGPATADRREDFRRRFTARLGSKPGVATVFLAADAPPGERVVIGEGSSTLPRARFAFWSAIARGVRHISLASSRGETAELLPLGETIGVVTRNPGLFDALVPRKAIISVEGREGGEGAPVDVKVLESPDVLMLFGLHAGSTPRAVRIRFPPDIPEAIWQNLETGAAVNFVMGPQGPVYEYVFAPHDTLVLMIRKKLR